MTPLDLDPLPFNARLGEYLRQAELTLDALLAGDEATAWRFKWMHPRFRDLGLADVRATKLTLDDAMLLVAREYFLEDWDALARFAADAAAHGPVARFEEAVESVIAGDLVALERKLAVEPTLVHEQSARRHHATLLHYIAANGVEGFRQ